MADHLVVCRRRMDMIVGNVMKTRVISVGEHARLEEAVRLLVNHRIGTLPVLSDKGVVLGILNLQDVLSLALPDFVDMVQNYDFVHNFGSFELADMDEATRNMKVTDLMDPPTAIESDSGLLRTYAFMRQHELRDVPVTDSEGRLLGIASRVDVGVGFLRSWLNEPEAAGS